jgi:hypothetical protein
MAAAMVKSGLLLGEIAWGKASIYTGFQSTHSQDGLWENLGLN